MIISEETQKFINNRFKIIMFDDKYNFPQNMDGSLQFKINERITVKLKSGVKETKRDKFFIDLLQYALNHEDVYIRKSSFEAIFEKNIFNNKGGN